MDLTYAVRCIPDVILRCQIPEHIHISALARLASPDVWRYPPVLLIYATRTFGAHRVDPSFQSSG